jgi:hypothetical protein
MSYRPRPKLPRPKPKLEIVKIEPVIRTKSGHGYPFIPTQDERQMVERLAALGVPHEAIARDWIKPPIHMQTMCENFREELANGAARVVAGLKLRLLRDAENGNMRSAIYLLERFYWKHLPESAKDAPQLPAPGEATGNDSGVYIVLPDNGRGFPETSRPNMTTDGQLSDEVTIEGKVEAA